MRSTCRKIVQQHSTRNTKNSTDTIIRTGMLNRVTVRVQAIGRTPESALPKLGATSDQPNFTSIYTPPGWNAVLLTGGTHLLSVWARPDGLDSYLLLIPVH